MGAGRSVGGKVLRTSLTHEDEAKLQAALSASTKKAWTAVIGRARTVAEAAGGFLGLGSKVSAAEEEVLRQLEHAFS